MHLIIREAPLWGAEKIKLHILEWKKRFPMWCCNYMVRPQYEMCLKVLCASQSLTKATAPVPLCHRSNVAFDPCPVVRLRASITSPWIPNALRSNLPMSYKKRNEIEKKALIALCFIHLLFVPSVACEGGASVLHTGYLPPTICLTPIIWKEALA